MQCFVCGEQMRVVMVEPHVINMQGFELRTFQCVACGDVEKRPVFDRTRSPQPIVPGADPKAAAPEPTPPAVSSKMKSILGGLVRLRGSSGH